MNRSQHSPKFAIDGLSYQHFIVDNVKVTEDVTHTHSKSCQGDESLNVENCSESRVVVKRKTTTTVFKSPQQLQVIRPVDRLPLVFEGREQALLATVTEMKNIYRKKGTKRVRADVVAAQLENLLSRFNAK